MHELLDRLEQSLLRIPAPLVVRVAYSGGPDSTALLDGLARLRPRHHFTLAAVHVDHRLQPQSAQWARQCRASATRLGVTIEDLVVDAQAGAGESPEAAARRARYAALVATTASGSVLAMAHHRDDQAETIVLQLLRGAGPAGLAAMPRWRRFGTGWLWRPLLDEPARALRDYARAQELEWVSDPSNEDLELDRNYLRHEVLPSLRRRWPGVDITLARAASIQADALGLIDDLADLDHASVNGGNGTLACSGIRDLPRRRARNVLRRWLALRALPAPNHSQVERIIDEVVMAAPDRQPQLRWPGAEIRRSRDELHAMIPLAPHDPDSECDWDPRAVLRLEHGELRACPARGVGLASRFARRGRLRVAFRRGGERCRPLGRRRSQTLKRLFQEHGVAPWERDRVPLVYVQDRLAAVGDLWICDGFQAAPDEAGWVLEWVERNA